MIQGIPFLLLSALHLPHPLPVPAQGVQVGDVPSYQFKQPVFQGMDTASLEDLRGKPLLIEFWGHKSASLDETMREALLLQEAYGDDLTVLFAEVKQASDLLATSVALHKKWLGGRAMWTTETPCRVGLKGALPQFVLLSSEGVVLLKGTTESFELCYREELVEAVQGHIDAEVERRRCGPADLPEVLVPAWEAFSKGRIAKAFELARSQETHPDADAALVSAARETLAVFRKRLDQRLERVAWQVENGYLLQAEESLALLEGQLEAEPGLTSKRDQLSVALGQDALQAEWKAARDLAKLELKLHASGPKSTVVKQLERLARKHVGTKSAERAAYLVEAAEVSPFK